MVTKNHPNTYNKAVGFVHPLKQEKGDISHGFNFIGEFIAEKDLPFADFSSAGIEATIQPTE